MPSISVCVVGGGCSGLSTAVAVQDLIPNAEVTIISDRWGLETTSDGAAGLFRPDNVQADNPADIPRWLSQSADHFWRLYHGPDTSSAGISQLSGYVLSNDNPGLVEATQYRDLVPNYRRLQGTELDRFGGPWRYGCFHSTVVIEPRIYMTYLKDKFQKAGGKILNRSLGRLTDLAQKYTVVVNCTGLGSIKLIGDQSMVPVRGQLIRVRAPWCKEFLMGESTTYIYPNSETVVLGGTRQTGDWNTDVDPEDTVGVLQRCNRMLPALAGAPVIREWAGLRPWRPTVRLEKELFQLDGDRTLPVVHNYGHGGNGISLSWGCAVEAAKLVKAFVDELELQSPATSFPTMKLGSIVSLPSTSQ